MTHSIPDCCGLILRSEHGTIVHTGDWKIEEDPVDGQQFDRTLFEKIGEQRPHLERIFLALCIQALQYLQFVVWVQQTQGHGSYSTQ